MTDTPKWSCVSKQTLGEIHLGLGVLFTGLSLTGQKFAMEQDIGPLTYNAWRFLLSTTLILCSRKHLQNALDSEYQGEDGTINGPSDSDEEQTDTEVSKEIPTKSLFTKSLLFWGIIVGICDFFGNLLQQVALVSVSVGKVGFISGMYVVFVPLIERLLPGRRHQVPLKAWVAAFTSVIGTYFLSGCVTSSECMDGAVGNGEILTFISVAAWVVQIMCADTASKHVDCISLVCVSFVVCTILTLITAVIFEFDEWLPPYHMSWYTWSSIVVVGISEVSSVTFTTLGQMYVPAARASLLMSMENVSSAVGGYLFLNETLNLLEFFGCFIMFVATLISSVDWIELLYGNTVSSSDVKGDVRYAPLSKEDDLQETSIELTNIAQDDEDTLLKDNINDN